MYVKFKLDRSISYYIISVIYGMFVYILFMVRHGYHSVLTPEIYYYSLVSENKISMPWYEWTHHIMKLFGIIPHLYTPYAFSIITIFSIALWSVLIYKITCNYFGDTTAKISYILTVFIPFFNSWRMGFFTHDVIQITIWLVLWELIIVKKVNKTMRKAFTYSVLYCIIAILSIPVNFALVPGVMVLLIIIWYPYVMNFKYIRIVSLIGVICVAILSIHFGRPLYPMPRIADSVPYYTFPKDLLMQLGIPIILAIAGLYSKNRGNDYSFVLAFTYYGVITIFFMAGAMRYWIFYILIFSAAGIVYLYNEKTWALSIILLTSIFWQGTLIGIWSSGEYVANNGVHEVEWIAMTRMNELPEGTILTIWDRLYPMLYLSGHDVKGMDGEIWWKNQEVAYDMARKNEVRYIYLTNYEFRILGEPIYFAECKGEMYPFQTKFVSPNAPCISLSEQYFPTRFIYFAMYKQDELYGFESVNWIWQEDIYGYNTELQILIIEVLQ